MTLLGLLGAFGGGIFGAAIGALPAFILVGLLILVGIAINAGGGGGAFLFSISLGALFSPWTGGFAAGVAAAAYAAKKGKLESGRDISTAVMGLNMPSALIVGGIFGVLGYVIVNVLGGFLGSWTDVGALTVVLSAIIARLIWGSKGIFGKCSGANRYAPDDATKWLVWQSGTLQKIAIGLGAGLFAAYAAKADPNWLLLGFAFSAFSLFFLQYGTKVPVTHHITLTAAVATAASGSLIWGAVFGLIAAFVGDFMSHVFLIWGDTHIDPPACTIVVLTTLSILLAKLGVYALLALP